MARQGSESINALVRGLKVLAALNDLNDGSVGDLARASGVAKTTVIRILKTLVREGYASHDDAQIYRVTEKVAGLSRGLVGADNRRRVVQPILDRLQELKWPVEFLIADGLSMVIVQNNRDRAPIKLSLFERRRFPMLESAAGMAYLSALPQADRGPLMRAAADANPGASLPAARRWLSRTIAAGYAERDLKELSPGMRALAVPVSEKSPLGALALIYFHDMVSPTTLDRDIIPRLNAAATDTRAAIAGL